MEIGMLWFDDSPLSLKDRLEKAAGYYAEKFGSKPNLCLVHPSMLTTDETRFDGVLVRRGRGVMPGHFWIGVDDEPAKQTRPRPAQPAPSKRSNGGQPAAARPSAKPSKSSRSAGSRAGKPAAARGQKSGLSQVKRSGRSKESRTRPTSARPRRAQTSASSVEPSSRSDLAELSRSVEPSTGTRPRASRSQAD